MSKELKCERCGRYLKITVFGTAVMRVVCTDRKCKHINDVKIVSADHAHDLLFKFPPADGETSVAE